MKKYIKKTTAMILALSMCFTNLCYSQEIHICNLEEHVHNDNCYESVFAYETATDSNATASNATHSNAEEYKELICDLEEHIHNEYCDGNDLFTDEILYDLERFYEIVNKLPETEIINEYKKKLEDDYNLANNYLLEFIEESDGDAKSFLMNKIEECFDLLDSSLMIFLNKYENLTEEKFYEKLYEYKSYQKAYEKLLNISTLINENTILTMNIDEKSEPEYPYFTASWIEKIMENGNHPTVKIYCKDEDGRDLLENRFLNKTFVKNIVNVDKVGNIILADYANLLINDANIPGYFVKAEANVNNEIIVIDRVSYNDESSNKTGQLGWLYYKDSTWIPWDDDGNELTDNKMSEVEINLIYKSIIVDTNINEDISITLYDYGSEINTDSSSNISRLDFIEGNGTKYAGHTSLDGPTTSANDNGGGYAKEMHETLDNLNPAYKSGSEIKSLEYLFDDTLESSNEEYVYDNIRNHASYNNTNGYKTNFDVKKYTMNGDGGLLSIDENGYYSFDSGKNSAYFNGSRFEVYDALIAPGHRNVDYTSSTVGTYYYNFFPFDQPYAISKNNIKQHPNDNKDVYFTYYNGITSNTAALTDANTEEITALKNNVTAQTVTNLWFGMKMEFDFVMPTSGIVTDENGNQSSMTFEFSGDDDVYVYIDDVLILDIGGTHGKLDGTINFETGDVEYIRKTRSDNEKGTNENGIISTPLDSAYNEITDETKTSFVRVETTISDLYKNALDENDARLNKLNGNTFKDYSDHSLKFYYLDRGGNLAFCKLKFNMPILPKNSFSVTKQLEVDNGDLTDILGNQNYNFQLLNAETDLPFAEEGTPYVVTDSSGNFIEERSLDENGIFYIKPGQIASFREIENIIDDYYIRELISEGFEEQYGTVEVNGESKTYWSYILVNDQEFAGIDSNIMNYSDGTTLVTFINHILKDNIGSLKITKKLKGNSPIDGYFYINIKIDDTPINVGYSYQIEDAFGVIKDCEVTEEGIIPIKENETIILDNIILGSEFLISETEESTKNYTVEYNGDCSIKEANGVLSATGKIETKNEYKVNITNTSRDGIIYIDVELPVNQKRNSDGSVTGMFLVYGTDVYGNEHKYVATAELTETDAGKLFNTITIENVPFGTYTVEQINVSRFDKNNMEINNEINPTFTINAELNEINILSENEREKWNYFSHANYLKNQL